MKNKCEANLAGSMSWAEVLILIELVVAIDQLNNIHDFVLYGVIQLGATMQTAQLFLHYAVSVSS